MKPRDEGRKGARGKGKNERKQDYVFLGRTNNNKRTSQTPSCEPNFSKKKQFAKECGKNLETKAKAKRTERTGEGAQAPLASNYSDLEWDPVPRVRPGEWGGRTSRRGKRNLVPE